MDLTEILWWSAGMFLLGILAGAAGMYRGQRKCLPAFFAVSPGQKPCPAVPFSDIFSCPDAVLFLSVFCPISPDRRKNRQNKIFHRGRGCFFSFS